jgi:hypothetical protein
MRALLWALHVEGLVRDNTPVEDRESDPRSAAGG